MQCAVRVISVQLSFSLDEILASPYFVDTSALNSRTVTLNGNLTVSEPLSR